MSLSKSLKFIKDLNKDIRALKENCNGHYKNDRE
nr:MAG TPA: hypothetical protein [Bacteriophage sp.]